MKKTTLHITLLLLLLVHGFTRAQGQQDKIRVYERVQSFTDRNMFIVGEKVHFSAFVFPADGEKQAFQSRILYCEIITPEGIKIAGSKYLLHNNSSNGCLEIPKEISTGMYYFRSYTKYMRNQGPYSYDYTRLKIVNPFRSNVLPGNSEDKDSILIHQGDKEKSYDLSLEKRSYFPGEIINVTLEQVDTVKRSGVNCLSVVPESSVLSTITQIPGENHFVNNLFNYPETSGLSITGKISDNLTGAPIKGTRINLSIIGKGKDFMANITDTAGRFYFSLPGYTGYRDIFLSAANDPSLNPKIQVDNDFCSLPVHLPSPVFTLSDEERQTAYNMAVNLQLSGKFSADTLPAVAKTEDSMDKAFYGTPSEILTIDKYVLLPSLEEYFNELPTMVKVRKREGKKYFKVFGTQDALSVIDPLIMLDWVAVDDPEKILAVSPRDISRIEIVNDPYVKGDQLYGGIISIISRRSDFAGIDLPSSGLFVNYRFLEDTSDCMIKTAPSLHQPDTRNTLFWQPQMLFHHGKAKISFRAPEIPGKYLIIMKGVANGGKILTRSIVFETRPGK